MERSKFYGSYKHLLEKEKELGINAPEELTLLLFGMEEVEVTKEVANNYKTWIYEVTKKD